MGHGWTQMREQKWISASGWPRIVQFSDLIRVDPCPICGYFFLGNRSSMFAAFQMNAAMIVDACFASSAWMRS